MIPLLLLFNLSLQNQLLTPGDPEFWLMGALALGVCCFAGLCSGLTVGYLSVEQMELQILQISGTSEEQALAKAILPVIRQHHRLIATLLLSNALAMESLPIIMHRLMPEWLAIIFSSVIVVVLGQILPQAVCTGPSKLQIAWKCIPLINGLMFVTYPFAGPVASILDYALGHHERKRFGRKDLRAIIKVHEEEGLSGQEVKLLRSILELREQRVQKVMIPLDKLYMLQSRDEVSLDLLKEVKQLKYSNIPVFERNRANILGVIKSKQFANRLDCFLGRKVEGIKLHPFLVIYAGTNLLHVLMLMEEKQAHIAFVSGAQRPKHNAIASIYMSKSDMLVKEDTAALNLRGAVFLSDLFKELADEHFADMMEQFSHIQLNPFIKEQQAHLLDNSHPLS